MNLKLIGEKIWLSFQKAWFQVKWHGADPPEEPSGARLRSACKAEASLFRTSTAVFCSEQFEIPFPKQRTRQRDVTSSPGNVVYDIASAAGEPGYWRVPPRGRGHCYVLDVNFHLAWISHEKWKRQGQRARDNSNGNSDRQRQRLRFANGNFCEPRLISGRAQERNTSENPR